MNTLVVYFSFNFHKSQCVYRTINHRNWFMQKTTR